VAEAPPVQKPGGTDLTLPLLLLFALVSVAFAIRTAVRAQKQPR
jgi:hypothetical protein